MKAVYPIEVFGIKNIGIECWFDNYYFPVTGKEYSRLYEKVFDAYMSSLKKYAFRFCYRDIQS